MQYSYENFLNEHMITQFADEYSSLLTVEYFNAGKAYDEAQKGIR